MEKDNWTTKDMIDITDKVAIITGGNSGLGKETAKVLAQKGAVVIIAVRSMEKGKTAASDIKGEFPDANVDVMELDLSSLASVRSFSKAFQAKYKQLDYLINNAGVMVPPYSKTEDGFELQFGTNHLGHFALTGLLLPLIMQSKDGRIVSVSSVAHRRGSINFEDLNWESREYSAWQAYADSKIANLYFTYELARKLKDSKVTVAASHPGWTQTNLQKNSLPFRVLSPLFSQKPNMGALPSLRAATDENVKNGEYYGPGGRGEYRGHPEKVDSNEVSKDRYIAKRLWDVSEKLTKVKY